MGQNALSKRCIWARIPKRKRVFGFSLNRRCVLKTRVSERAFSISNTRFCRSKFVRFPENFVYVFSFLPKKEQHINKFDPPPPPPPILGTIPRICFCFFLPPIETSNRKCKCECIFWKKIPKYLKSASVTAKESIPPAENTPEMITPKKLIPEKAKKVWAKV